MNMSPGAMPLPPLLEAPMGLPPEALMGAQALPPEDPMAAMAAMQPQGPDPLTAATSPDLLAQAIAQALDAAKQGAMAQVDQMTTDAAAQAIQHPAVQAFFAPEPEPMRGAVGGMGAPLALPPQEDPTMQMGF